MCHLVIDGVIQQVAYHSDGRLPAHLRSEKAAVAQTETVKAVAVPTLVNISFVSGEREAIRIPDSEKSRSRSHGHRGRSRHDAPARRRVIRNFLNRIAV
jgi:hypothetical protein